jgi:outer membrane lipoprotein
MMKYCLIRLVIVLAIGITAVSCAGGISREVRSQTTYFGEFADLQQQPGQYTGETIILGGKIIETRVAEGATEMEILQLSLNGSDRPQDNDQSQGRFLVRTRQFLDPAIYPKGTLVTVGGRILGGETGAIGAMPYTYPSVELIEIKKWPPQDSRSPRFHFGVGVGTHF